MTSTAWYIIPSRNPLARWFNVLHWPYTLWHLSYVAIGAALAAEMSWPLLGWTALAFFLAMGVASHCLDLVKGDPLRLGLSPTALKAVALVALCGATAIGGNQWALGNLPWEVFAVAVPAGVFIAAGYNLEWPGMHGDWQFAAWWAVFPFLVGYFAQGIAWHPVLLPMAIFLFLTALVQRVLSTRVRYLRRRVGYARVQLVAEDGQVLQAEKDWLLEADEKALAGMTAAMVLFAAAALSSQVWP